MRRLLPRLLLATAALVLVALAGPRTCVREPDIAAVQAAVPTSLVALPTWIADHEQRAGVTDTAVAARVRFANTTAPARTPWSVVYLHGFSATRQETAPVAERVAAALGANLFETRLHGHGLPGDSLGAVSARDWLHDAITALAIGRTLGDSVLVIGTSTGGTLGIWLATRPPAERTALQALVLISPNLGARDPRAEWLSTPWANVLLPLAIPTHSWEPRNTEHARYWTTRYPSRALFPMQALVERVRGTTLDDYTVPTLLFYHDDDDVVDSRRTLAWIERVRDRDETRLETVQVIPTQGEDHHVLTGRIVSPSQTQTFVQRIVRFVRTR